MYDKKERRRYTVAGAPGNIVCLPQEFENARNNNSNFKLVSGVALGIAVTVALGLGIYNLSKKPYEDTKEDPKPRVEEQYRTRENSLVPGYSNWVTELRFTGEVISSNETWIDGKLPSSIYRTAEFREQMGEFKGITFYDTGVTKEEADGTVKYLVRKEYGEVEEVCSYDVGGNGESFLFRNIEADGTINGSVATYAVTYKNPQAVRDEIEHNKQVVDRITGRKH